MGCGDADDDKNVGLFLVNFSHALSVASMTINLTRRRFVRSDVNVGETATDRWTRIRPPVAQTK